MLNVEDDGAGMDSETLTRMFEPFFTTKDEGQGTGLGLAICQSIVREVGGFIEVMSELGRGTKIQVFLPRKTTAATRLRPAPPQSGVVRAPRVLLVFGPNIDRDVAVPVGQAGYHVTLVNSAKEAVRLLGAAPLDVLVIDSELGQEAAKLPQTARALYPHLQVVGIEATMHDAARVLDAEVHLYRPLYGHGLVEGIDSALQSGGAGEDAEEWSAG